MAAVNKSKGIERIEAEIEKIDEQIYILAKRYREDFGDQMKSRKLILLVKRRGDKINGPYWMRSRLIESKTRKRKIMIFDHLGLELSKGDLISGEEKQEWPRIKIYSDEVKRLREAKKRLNKDLKKLRKN
jgi:hypothetical protein